MISGGVAPGWYPDYEAPPGHQRYWNGERWTERRSSAPTSRPARPAPTAASRTPWIVAAVAVLVVASASALVLGDRETGTSGAASPPSTASTPGPPPSDQPTPDGDKQQTWKVEAAVDGSTIELTNGVRVRIAGISDGCARDALARLVVGRRVTLTRKGADKDAGGRLLRYVERDGLDVGKRMIQRGWASAADEANPRRAIYRRIDDRSPDACTP